MFPIVARRLLLSALLVASIPAFASAAGGIGVWGTALYAGGARGPSTSSRALPPETACVAAILDAEREHAIVDHSLLAMGFTESGRMTRDRRFTVWPWTINAEGQSYFYETREEAIASVRDFQARGIRSIDVGCMQVNLRWHPDAFPDLHTAFEPIENIRYAARFLSDLTRERGDQAQAIGRYHSAQSELSDAYRRRVDGNRRWVAQALARLDERPATGSAGPVFIWSAAESGRLAFLSSLFADGPVRPATPAAIERRGEGRP